MGRTTAPETLRSADDVLDTLLGSADEVIGGIAYLRLRLRGVTAFDDREARRLDPLDPRQRARAVRLTLEASLQLLDESDQERYRDLAAFPAAEGDGCWRSAPVRMWRRARPQPAAAPNHLARWLSRSC
jgi:hypothetical protein